MARVNPLKPRILYLIDTLLVVSFVAAAFIGLLMGFVITRDEDVLWGQSRHEWGYIHFVVAVALVVLIITHFVLHWDWVKLMARRQAPHSLAVWSLMVSVLILVILYVGSVWTPPGLYATAPRHLQPTAPTKPQAQVFKSLGEQIYFSNIGEGGRAIPFAGGPGWLRAHGAACVDCHGSDGRGGRHILANAIAGPDIRYSILTGQQVTPGEEIKPPRAFYTDTTIKRAIIYGLDAEGAPLDIGMPRYQMTDTEAAAIIGYLKELSLAPRARAATATPVAQPPSAVSVPSDRRGRLSHIRRGGATMWGWMHGVGGWGLSMMIIMMLFWLLVLVGIVSLVWFLIASARRAACPMCGTPHPQAAHRPPMEESALDILDRRYAAGEITREQYQEMKRELEGRQ